MIPLNIRHQHSVLGCVPVRPLLTALLGQYTTLPPISPGWARTAPLRSPSTVAIKSRKSFRLLVQVSGRSFNVPSVCVYPTTQMHQDHQPLAASLTCLPRSLPKGVFSRYFRDLLSKSVGKVDFPIRPCFLVNREKQRPQVQPVTR